MLRESEPEKLIGKRKGKGERRSINSSIDDGQEGEGGVLRFAYLCDVPWLLPLWCSQFMEMHAYPKGSYYVSLDVGQPPKPYYFDIDTGIDLTWLQCDYPCISCTEAPHPLYKPPKKNEVFQNDTLCISAFNSPEDHESVTPDEPCDWHFVRRSEFIPWLCKAEVICSSEKVFLNPSDVIWTRMSRSSEHYSRRQRELIFGGQPSGVRNLLVVFDTGGSYTYFNFQAYQAFISWVKKDLNGKPLREARDDETFSLL
ncbi:hypothetical protein HHK36_030419 [Tetracentron sinense]|uniref:Peptidase A1 domain-containing protein n=1 Tax=Tetracentron sinense TaxID=13715 RepID=A0A835CY95_TETSI|nr:hypothetical protein HHK36_030419 [Tetracentron sinense]